jgi:hypothetical protein
MNVICAGNQCASRRARGPVVPVGIVEVADVDRRRFRQEPAHHVRDDAPRERVLGVRADGGEHAMCAEHNSERDRGRDDGPIVRDDQIDEVLAEPDLARRQPCHHDRERRRHHEVSRARLPPQANPADEVQPQRPACFHRRT